MFPDSPFAHPVSSFQSPVPPPDAEPDDEPLAAICVNETWLRYLRGAAKQLLLQSTWLTDNPDELALAQQRAATLIGQLQDGVLNCFTPAIPNWQAINESPGTTREWFGQRGQGLAGAFFDYAGLAFTLHLTFEDISTHAAVGGLINVLRVSNLSGEAASVTLTSCSGSAVTEPLGVGDHDVMADLFGGAHEIKEVLITSDDLVYVRMILKFNWTCEA